MRFRVTFFLTLSILALAAGLPCDEYKGGRPGYSEASLRLCSDSTYLFYEHDHTGMRVHDRGRWSRYNNNFCLSSTRKNGKPARFPRFVRQEFSIKGDTLRFVPKNAEQAGYFFAYYTFVKSHP